MMTKKLICITAAAAVLVSASYAVHDLTGKRADAAPYAATQTSAAIDAPAGGAETARLIRAYEAVARTHRDEGVDVMLGSLYLQRGRFTGDLGTYRQALAAADEAVRLAPRVAGTAALLASTRFALHDWAGARAAAERAVALDPRQQNAELVIGDCDVETGRYAEAAAIDERMAAAVPGSASVTVRLARLAWATGDLAHARRLADLAVAQAPDNGASGATLAFYDVFASQLAIDAGDYVAAVRTARRATAAAPDWHVAIAAAARASAAAGDVRGAIRDYSRAAQIVPLPEYLSALGDLYRIAGRPAAAREQYATVLTIARIAAAERHVYNRQIVLFAADHGVDRSLAVRLAQAELSTRRDAAGYDALAWALHAGGRDREARLASDHALSVSAVDPRFEWHAAAIAAGLGDRARAVALLTDVLHRTPRFDPLQSRRAASLLRSLETGR
jgi:tetratricopeptide (TPR) repeat protein